jgi:hypothetical protein
MVGMLMYEGGLEIVPPEMREVLAEIAPKAYAAHCEHVHGTPTPPRSSEVGLGTRHVRRHAYIDGQLPAATTPTATGA